MRKNILIEKIDLFFSVKIQMQYIDATQARHCSSCDVIQNMLGENIVF